MKWWLWRACLFFSNGHESKYISSEVLFIGVVPKTPGHRNYHKDTWKSTRKRMISKLSITNKNNPVVIQAWHPWHSPSHRSWGICVLICEQLTSRSKHSDPLDWWTPYPITGQYKIRQTRKLSETCGMSVVWGHVTLSPCAWRALLPASPPVQPGLSRLVDSQSSSQPQAWVARDSLPNPNPPGRCPPRFSALLIIFYLTPTGLENRTLPASRTMHMYCTLSGQEHSVSKWTWADSSPPDKHMSVGLTCLEQLDGNIIPPCGCGVCLGPAASPSHAPWLPWDILCSAPAHSQQPSGTGEIDLSPQLRFAVGAQAEDTPSMTSALNIQGIHLDSW